jgi:signal transduction histidine kinase
MTRLAKVESVRWWQSNRTVPLSWYLVAIISIATVPLALFAAYLVLQQTNAAQDQLARNLRASASALALTVERDLATSTEVLRAFGDPDNLAHADRTTLDREVTRLLARRADWIGVFLIDADGAVVVARGDERALALVNARAIRPLQAGPPSAGDGFQLIRQRVAAEDLTAVIVPVASLNWTLGAVFQPNKWQTLLDRLPPDVDGFAGIFDLDKRWIARVAKPERNAHALAGERFEGAVDAPGTQRLQRVAAPGEEAAYVAWQAVDATGWSAVVGLVAEPFERRQRQSIGAALLGGILALAVGLVSALVVSHGITSPLARLAAGLWPQRTGGRRPAVAEIERLTQALEVAESERDADRAALQAKADEFETLFRRTPVGLAVTNDPDCRHLVGNAALAQMLGVPAQANFSLSREGEDSLHSVKFYAGRQELAFTDLPLYAAAQRGEESQGVECTAVRTDGATVQLLAYAAPLRASDGTTRGAVGAFVDVTERTRKDMHLRETQERLEASEQRVELAQVIGGVGFFEYDFVRDTSVWTSGMGKLFGIEPTAFAGTWAAWAEVVEPEDVTRVRSQVDVAVAAHAPTVVYEYRARHRDGSVRVLASRALLLYGDDGKALRMVGVAVDITEQHRTASERSMLLAREQQARQDAESANRSKDEFLAMFSHELRNPLSAISAAAEVLHRLGGHRPDEIRARDVIKRQIHHLTRMMEDLLDVTRVINGKVTLSRAPLDLAAAVQRAASALNVTGRLRDHRLELDLAPAWIHADSTRIEQIASNLLVNAAKYTPGGGTISVKVAAEGDRALLVVSDTGVGIHPDMLDRIFDLFVQVDRASTRRQGGLGIGLTLVRRLVELQGGTVIAISEGVDRGSRFEIRIPRITPPSRA